MGAGVPGTRGECLGPRTRNRKQARRNCGKVGATQREQVIEADMANDAARLTQLAHGGGCGCKLAPGVLQEILGRMPVASFPDLMVGTETSDDAAVYRLSDSQALVATTDFFMPMVDDPHDFGRIAATNALSDVYAM